MADEQEVRLFKGRIEKMRYRRGRLMEDWESAKKEEAALQKALKDLQDKIRNINNEAAGLKLAVDQLKVEVPEAFEDEAVIPPES